MLSYPCQILSNSFGCDYELRPNSKTHSIDLAESTSDRIPLDIIDLELMMKTLTLKNLYLDSFGLGRMFCHDCATVFVKKRRKRGGVGCQLYLIQYSMIITIVEIVDISGKIEVHMVLLGIILQSNEIFSST